MRCDMQWQLRVWRGDKPAKVTSRAAEIPPSEGASSLWNRPTNRLAAALAKGEGGEDRGGDAGGPRAAMTAAASANTPKNIYE